MIKRFEFEELMEVDDFDLADMDFRTCCLYNKDLRSK